MATETIHGGFRVLADGESDTFRYVCYDAGIDEYDPRIDLERKRLPDTLARGEWPFLRGLRPDQAKEIIGLLLEATNATGESLRAPA